MGSNSGKLIQDKIRKVLMEQWDPIGISDTPECADEYDSYIGGIYKLLQSKASDDDLIDHLNQIETDRMGLTLRTRESLVGVVRFLRKIDLNMS